MGEKYLAKWNEKFFAQIHGLPGFPLKSFVSCRASNGLPFVRRPWKTVRLGYLYSKSISKHFRKAFHRFQKARKIWAKNISQSEMKSFCSNPRSSGLPIEILCFLDGLLTVFLFLEDSGRPSDLDICTVTQYLSIFTKHFIGFRKREKYGWKISRKVKWKVFAQIHGLPGFLLKSFVSWRASNGLSFLRRPWKTIRLELFHSKSISEHFGKLFS